MSGVRTRAIDEATIRDVIDSWAKALSNNSSRRLDIQQITTTIGIDVAFVSARMRYDSSEEKELDQRLTMGLRKIDGQWIITHEHHSIPA